MRLRAHHDGTTPARPRTYTKCCSVALTEHQLRALERYAAAQFTRIGTLMREAALRITGHAELIIATETPPRGPAGAGPSRPLPRRQYGYRAMVRLTAAQKKALQADARKRRKALSALLREAALLEAGMPFELPPAEPAPGRPVGSPKLRRRRRPAAA